MVCTKRVAGNLDLSQEKAWRLRARQQSGGRSNRSGQRVIEPDEGLTESPGVLSADLAKETQEMSF